MSSDKIVCEMANLDKNTGSLQGRHMGIPRSRSSRLLLNRLSVEISLLLAHFEGNPNATVTGGFPSHSAESVSMSWRGGGGGGGGGGG